VSAARAVVGPRACVDEPAGRGVVVQTDPGRDPLCPQGFQRAPVALDRLVAAPAVLRLDPGPLDDDPVRAQAVRGEEGGVPVGVVGEPVARARGRGSAGALPRPPVAGGVRALRRDGRGGGAPRGRSGTGHRAHATGVGPRTPVATLPGWLEAFGTP